MKPLVAFGWLVLTVVAPAQAEELVLSTAAGPPYSTDSDGTPGFLDLLLGEAFGRLGIGITLKKLPAERALLNADAGIEDGDAYRIAGLEKVYPNLVPVPESIMDMEFVAYSNGTVEPVRSWADLKGYSVGIVTGWKILENNLKGVALLTRVKNTEQLFELLHRDRADLVMYEKWQGLAYLRSQNLHFQLWPEAFARTPMFTYLHKKHQDLAEPLAAILRDMKRDGTQQRIIDRTLTPLE